MNVPRLVARAAMVAVSACASTEPPRTASDVAPPAPSVSASAAGEEEHDDDAHHVAPDLVAADPVPATPAVSVAPTTATTSPPPAPSTAAAEPPRAAGKSKPPSFRGPCATSVSGRMAPGAIDRIVKANMKRFRLCYDAQRSTNGDAKGRVSVKFVIDRSGAVSMAADGGSTFPDPVVVQCVVRGFGNLSFPEPEGGIVTVVYPLDLP